MSKNAVLGLNVVARSPELLLIESYYGDRKAKRSGVPLIQHIHEGVSLMVLREASPFAIRAYCLHPIVQADEDLIQNAHLLENMNGAVVALAMEYRKIANLCLSTRQLSNPYEIELSVVTEVNEMLIADKVQNYRDFLKYHKDTHPRSAELDRYFRFWLERLGVDSHGRDLVPGPVEPC